MSHLAWLFAACLGLACAGGPLAARAQTPAVPTQQTLIAPPSPAAPPAVMSPAAPSAGQAAPAPNTARPDASTPRARQELSLVERRITDLHRRLKISQDQEPRWQDFATVMRENAVNMDHLFEQQQDRGSLTALAQMQGYVQLATVHAQDMQRLLPAFEQLYNSMPDAQKKLTDQVFRETARRGAAGTHR